MGPHAHGGRLVWGLAAAVAGGLLPIAPGSDGGGSIRIPAAFCGLVGHKATRGLVPNPHETFETIGISVVGPLARSVPDAAALLDTLCGFPEGAGLLAACRQAPPRLRVAVTVESSIIAAHPDVQAAVGQVARARLAGPPRGRGPAAGGQRGGFLPIFRCLVANTPVLAPRYCSPHALAARRGPEGGQGHRVAGAR
ncbi:MAG: hypothetical protein IPG17_27495 [Sandaracinaceae bacterium]|nr:hypothetical protein [Sandaracinaceae bacterium]